PGRAEHTGDRVAQAVMGIRDDQLDARQPAPDQALDEAGPEWLRFRGTDPEADDFAPAVGRNGDSDYCRDRDDTAALAHFQIEPAPAKAGVASSHRYGHSPSIGRSRKAVTRSSMSLHSLETWLFEMPLSPIAWTSSSTRRVETPPIQASWMTATSAFSAILRSRGQAGCQRCGRGSR